MSEANSSFLMPRISLRLGEQIGPARGSEQPLGELLETVQVFDRKNGGAGRLPEAAKSDLAKTEQNPPGLVNSPLELALPEAFLASFFPSPFQPLFEDDLIKRGYPSEYSLSEVSLPGK